MFFATDVVIAGAGFPHGRATTARHVRVGASVGAFLTIPRSMRNTTCCKSAMPSLPRANGRTRLRGEDSRQAKVHLAIALGEYRGATGELLRDEAAGIESPCDEFAIIGPKFEVSREMYGTRRKPRTDWRRGWDSNPRDPFEV